MFFEVIIYTLVIFLQEDYNVVKVYIFIYLFK